MQHHETTYRTLQYKVLDLFRRILDRIKKLIRKPTLRPAVKEELFALYSSSMEWLENYEKKPQVYTLKREEIGVLFNRYCEAYDKMYQDLTQKVDSIATVIEHEHPPNEALLYIYYDDLGRRLKVKFEDIESLNEVWQRDNYSPNYTKLKYPVGGAPAELIADLYSALHYIHELGPKKLGKNLLGHIQKLEDLRFSCEKAALLMLLQCWYSECLDKVVSITKIGVSANIKTPELPLHFERYACLRIVLKKDSDAHLKRTTLMIKLGDSTLNIIEFKPSIKDKSSDKDIFTQWITNWQSQEIEIPVEIRQKKGAPQIINALEFILDLTADKSDENVDITFTDCLKKVTPRYDVPVYDRACMKQDADSIRNWYEKWVKEIVKECSKQHCHIICVAGEQGIGGLAFEPKMLQAKINVEYLTVNNGSSLNSKIPIVALPECSYNSVKNELQNNIPVKIWELATIDDAYKCQELIRQNCDSESCTRLFALESFFKFAIPNVHLDADAASLLRRYFADFPNTEVPSRICFRLVELVEKNKFSYIGSEEVKDAWRGHKFDVQQELLHEVHDSPIHQKRVLKALSFALSPPPESAEKIKPEDVIPPDPNHAVKSSKIIEFYIKMGGNPEDTRDVVTTLEEFIKKGLIVMDGISYRYKSLSVWQCAYELDTES